MGPLVVVVAGMAWMGWPTVWTCLVASGGCHVVVFVVCPSMVGTVQGRFVGASVGCVDVGPLRWAHPVMSLMMLPR